MGGRCHRQAGSSWFLLLGDSFARKRGRRASSEKPRKHGDKREYRGVTPEFPSSWSTDGAHLRGQFLVLLFTVKSGGGRAADFGQPYETFVGLLRSGRSVHGSAPRSSRGVVVTRSSCQQAKSHHLRIHSRQAQYENVVECRPDGGVLIIAGIGITQDCRL
jgi:hypothetical protein